MATDAFGRLRVSNPYTLFEYYPSPFSSNANSGLDNDIWRSINTGTGSITYNSDNTMVIEANSNGDYAYRSTKLPMEYQPGKSRLIYLSTVPLSRLKTSGESFNIRIGLFSLNSNDPEEGVYLKTDGETIYFTECYGGTETNISQSNWNVDKFDGNGSSGKTITINSLLKNLLLVIDQEWLGVGRIRVGFNLDGVNFYAHQFIHNLTYPYTTSPRLPLNYHLHAITLSSAISTKQICCTCISEGGFTPLGRKNAISTPISGVNLQTATSKYVLLAIKLKSGFPNGILKLLNLDAFYPSGNNSQWASIELQLHSTVGNIGATSGALTFTGLNNSIVEAYTANTTGANITVSTDGFVIVKKFIENKTNLIISQEVYETLLTRAQVSQYDTLLVCGVASSEANAKIATSLEFIESI